MFGHYLKARLDPEGDLLSTFSARAGRLIFGRDSLHVFKLDSGVRIRGSKRQPKVTISPSALRVDSRPFESIHVSQTFELLPGDSAAILRRVRLANLGGDPVRLAVLSLHDPTSVNFRGASDPPGSIGVNAFNRGDHVAMDELGTDTGARVIGSAPSPRSIYMTKDKTRALELLGKGELPDSTDGISGPIMILMQSELGISPRGFADITIVSAFNSEHLEAATSTFRVLISDAGRGVRQADSRVFFQSSNQDLNLAFAWAVSAVNSAEGESNLLEKIEVLPSLSLVNPELCARTLAQIKTLQRRNGSLPHSEEMSREGILETALFLAHGSRYLRFLSEKAVRAQYSALRRAAEYLIEVSSSGPIRTDSSLVQGWRRHLKVGYPRGVLSEVNLTVAGALHEFGRLATLLRRGSDASRARKGSDLLIAGIKERLVESDSGKLVLNIDDRGRIHREETADQLVGLMRFQIDHKLASSIVHRLLKADFETGYGPRTIPKSSLVFVNGSYLQGQAGGYWTRAALAHALLCYHSGYPGIGSTQLGKVSKLALGALFGVPGQFPYWIDPENHDSCVEGSDPVAASRFIECLVHGELGLSEEGLRPPKVTPVNWLFISNLSLGDRMALFVGRHEHQVMVASTSTRLAEGTGSIYQRFEQLDSSNHKVVGGQFIGTGQLICLGNLSSLPSSSTLAVPLRDASMSRHLTASLQEFDPGIGRWIERPAVRVLERMTFTVVVQANSWRILKLCSPGPSSLS